MATILIVEDEQFLRETVSKKVKEAGYTTLEAENGKKGLDLALEHHPDLILLDLAMPEMDGLEVLSHIRHDQWGKDVPIIIMTNLTQDEKVMEAENLGAQAYFIKVNLNPDEVLQMIEDELKHHSSHNSTH